VVQEEGWHDLIVILDDANSEIYYAHLAAEETTATVMVGLRASRWLVRPKRQQLSTKQGVNPRSSSIWSRIGYAGCSLMRCVE
jgi:hypothetical protein